jgi:hypothetical protein
MKKKPRDDLDQRRLDAVKSMITLMCDTADKYDVCPVCLGEVFMHDLQRAIDKGIAFHVYARHAGDEQGLGGPPQ